MDAKQVWRAALGELQVSLSPANYETWLRERTGLKVDLAREGRKTGTSLSADIVARWRATRFFPIDEVLELGRESFRRAQNPD